jgi:hypothetical protein
MIEATEQVSTSISYLTNLTPLQLLFEADRAEAAIAEAVKAEAARVLKMQSNSPAVQVTKRIPKPLTGIVTTYQTILPWAPRDDVHSIDTWY